MKISNEMKREIIRRHKKGESNSDISKALHMPIVYVNFTIGKQPEDFGFERVESPTTNDISEPTNVTGGSDD